MKDPEPVLRVDTPCDHWAARRIAKAHFVQHPEDCDGYVQVQGFQGWWFYRYESGKVRSVGAIDVWPLFFAEQERRTKK